jgi:hypothetical protein
MNDFTVSSGRMEILRRINDHESGETYYRAAYVHAVELRTRWGHSYTHIFQFPDTDAGAVRAARFAQKIERFVRANGTDKLDLKYWDVRTIYGSDAYCDEEHDIVLREKEDALLNEYA